MPSNAIRMLAVALSVVLCISGRPGRAIEIDVDTVISAVNSTPRPVVIGRNASVPITVTVVDGGWVGELLPTGSASAVLFGGTVAGDTFLTEDSQLALSGGTIDGTLFSQHFTTVNIWSGKVHGYGDELAISASGNSVVNIYGGQIGEGSPLGWLSVRDAGTINIFGSNLETVSGRVVGTLSDGTHLDRRFIQRDRGRIVLHNIPEPNTSGLALLGIVLGLVGDTRRIYRGGGRRLATIANTA